MASEVSPDEIEVTVTSSSLEPEHLQKLVDLVESRIIFKDAKMVSYILSIFLS